MRRLNGHRHLGLQDDSGNEDCVTVFVTHLNGKFASNATWQNVLANLGESPGCLQLHSFEVVEF